MGSHFLLNSALDTSQMQKQQNKNHTNLDGSRAHQIDVWEEMK